VTKQEEIERLKDKIRGLEKLNQMTDEEVIMELKAEINRLKALLIRAADDWLIQELRKAAEMTIHRPDSVPKDQAAVQNCADRSGPYSNPID
jgi:hypothetical protein